MTTLPKYSEQFDKITVAYIEDKILPYNRNFCFCGTLAPLEENNKGWSEKDYTSIQLNKMEFALLHSIREETFPDEKDVFFTSDHMYGELREKVTSHPNYENALFNGMVAALEVIKQIHIEKGEVIDETPSFQKRRNPSTLCVLDNGAGVMG